MLYQLRIIIHNLQKNRLFSIINLAGLAISLTACILIFIWVWDELSFDKFHKNSAQIYSVNQKYGENFRRGSIEALAPASVSVIPEIINTCRVFVYDKDYWEYNNTKFFSLKGAAIDTSFFDMFNFEILRGNISNPFTDHLSMIVSEKLAGIIFGSEDPIGKTIKSNDNKWFQITGVMKDMPQNTRFQYDFFVPFLAMQLDIQRADINTVQVESWIGFTVETYFQLNNNADVAQITDKVNQMVARRLDNIDNRRNLEASFYMLPLSKMRLYSPDGQPNGIHTVRLFGVIAIIILVIACINYVNLMTARASKRYKEISIKKIHGGKRFHLMIQLTGETALLYLVALSLSTFLVYLLFPIYNQIAGKEMIFSLLNQSVLQVYGITTVSVLLLAGLYPAILLSSFKPLDAFHGGVSGKSKDGYLRKSLIVVQFVFSIGLITAMIVIGSQLNYMRNKDLGYDDKNVFTFMVNRMYFHYETVKNELMKNPDIINVSAAYPGQMIINNPYWEGKNSNDKRPLIFYNQIIYHDYLQMMNIQLESGEYLSENDDSFILINEEAVKIMGMENPVGKQMKIPLNRGIDEYFTIKGIVKDFHFRTLKEPIKPMIVSLTQNPFTVYVRTVDGGAKSALASVEKLWKEYNAEIEFAYSFLEEDFERYYKADLRVGHLLNIFAFIAIFISCLGLFGLITFIAETKIKEIGIRKVLGANVVDIVAMLSKEFLVLIGLAMLIAFPPAYFWLNKMLQDYAYRININWQFFAFAGLITIILTLLTVGWQALKAATANPVEAIKSE